MNCLCRVFLGRALTNSVKATCAISAQEDRRCQHNRMAQPSNTDICISTTLPVTSAVRCGTTDECFLRLPAVFSTSDISQVREYAWTALAFSDYRSDYQLEDSNSSADGSGAGLHVPGRCTGLHARITRTLYSSNALAPSTHNPSVD